MKRGLLIVLSVVALGACSLENQRVPDFVGPSALSLSIDVKASPDVLVRDGASQSVIEVTVKNVSGQPVAGQDLTISNSLNLGTLATMALKTDASGKASTVYTAPGNGGTTTATITVAPHGSNFSNSVARTITIRLFQQQ